MGGKEILIKSTAQAVPVFTMMVFKIPKKTYAKGCQTPYLNSGGVMTMTIKEFIRRLGGNYAYQRKGEVWVLEIWKVSIGLY